MKKIGILVVCAIAVVVLYFFLTPQDSASKTGKVAPKETISLDPPSARLSATKTIGHEPAPAVNMLHVLLENLWAAARENNQPRVQEATKSLTDYLAAHPEAMSDLLAFFKDETDQKKLTLLTPILNDWESPEGRQLITEAALDWAQHDALPFKRQMGLSLLAKAVPVDEECMQSVAQICKTDSSDMVRLTAVDIINVWLTENPGRQDKLLGALSAATELSNNELVRGRALQVLAQQNAQLPEAVLKNVASSLAAPNPDSRIAAVMVLGDATDEAKGYALTQLEGAFRQETGVEVKKDILVQLVRLGKAQAADILRRLPNDNDIAQDIYDFSKIAASGKTGSVDEIYQQKFALEAERERIATAATTKPAP